MGEHLNTVISPPHRKHQVYNDYYPSFASLANVAASLNLEIAPGVVDVLRHAVRPEIKFFLSLPDANIPYWGVYAIVLEHKEYRPLLYIGSASSIPCIDGALHN